MLRTGNRVASQACYEFSSSRMKHFFESFKLCKILNDSGMRKLKDVQHYQYFLYFSCFHFLDKIFIQLQLNARNILTLKKTVYNFINSSAFGWRSLLLKISANILEYFESIAKKTRDTKRNKHKQLIAKTRPKFLCIDDTTLKKNRSKKLENFGRRLYDHSLQLYFKGYFIVVALFTDGVS